MSLQCHGHGCLYPPRAGARSGFAAAPSLLPCGVVDLFPAGPLDRVAVVPNRVDVGLGGERRISARAFDARGTVVRDGLAFRWTVEGDAFDLSGADGARPALAARSDARIGDRGRVRATVRQGDVVRIAFAEVEVVEPTDRDLRRGLGIPEPQLVHDPAGAWRSQFDGTTWRANAGHDDYRALVSDPRSKLRYLLSLFAVELVQHTFGIPGSAPLVDRVVELLAHAERNLRGS